tara:strand:- start:698 stop:967 length:270 start_codon:yes stop_codon:yes gene_type:complete
VLTHGDNMRQKIILLILILTIYSPLTSVNAESDNDIAVDNDDFNFIGYCILGLAMIGWTFFLLLLGGAILNVIKRARKPHIPKNPVKCK